MLPDRRSTRSVRAKSKNPLLTDVEKLDKFLDQHSQGGGRNKRAVATEVKEEDDPNVLYENFVKEQQQAKDNSKLLNTTIKSFEKK